MAETTPTPAGTVAVPVPVQPTTAAAPPAPSASTPPLPPLPTSTQPSATPTPQPQSQPPSASRYPVFQPSDLTRKRPLQSTRPLPSYGSTSSSSSSASPNPYSREYTSKPSDYLARSTPTPTPTTTTPSLGDRPVLPGLKSLSPTLQAIASSSGAAPPTTSSPSISSAVPKSISPPIPTSASSYRSNPMSVSSMLSGPPRDHPMSAYSSLPSLSAPSRSTPAQPPTLPKPSSSYEHQQRERESSQKSAASQPGTPREGSKPPTPRTGSGASPKVAAAQDSTTTTTTTGGGAGGRPTSSYPPLPSAFAREAPYWPLPGSGSNPSATSTPTTTTDNKDQKPTVTTSSTPTPMPTPTTTHDRPTIPNSHLPPWARSHLPGAGTASSHSTSTATGTAGTDTTQAAKAAASKTFFQHLGQYGRPPPRETTGTTPSTTAGTGTGTTHQRHGSAPGNANAQGATGSGPTFPWSASSASASAAASASASANRDRNQYYPTMAQDREREIIRERDRERQALQMRQDRERERQESFKVLAGGAGKNFGRFGEGLPQGQQQNGANASGPLASQLHKRRRSEAGLYDRPNTTTTTTAAESHTHSHAHPHTHYQPPPPPRPVKVPKVFVAPFGAKEARKEMVRPALVSVDNEMVWKGLEGTKSEEKVSGSEQEKEKEGEKEGEKEKDKMQVDKMETTTTALSTPPPIQPYLGRKMYDPFIEPSVLLSGSFMRNAVGGLLEILIPTALLGTAAWEIGDPKSYEGTPIPGAVMAGTSIGLGVPKEMWELDGLKERKVWGTDVYTDDSDVLAVLLHSGWLRVAEGEKKREGTEMIVVKVVVVPALIRYHGCTRMGIKSRSWGNGHDGVSIMVKEVTTMKDRLPSLGRRCVKLRAGKYAAESRRLRISAPPKQVTIGNGGESEDTTVVIDTFVLETRGKGRWIE